MLRWLSLIFLLCPMVLQAQTSRHTRLVGQMDFGKFSNDVWGYVDNAGIDYAIIGHIDGVSFIKVTDSGLNLVSFIPGERSTWRDIKTHGSYAYVTNETGGGLDIFDLSGLPDNVRFVISDSTAFRTAHNLYIADGFAYISGSNVNRGAEILDLANPEQPEFVGSWSEEYFHDIFVLGDRLYGSAGSDAKIVVLDISNKANPVRVADLPFPDGGYSHNAWATADGHYLMTTQETTDLTVKMWDIQDVRNPAIVGEYLSYPGRLAHNTHINGDFAYISHYADGLRIVDISDPEQLVEVGYYDTDESSAPGFTGNWGAFPFTQAGFVYASDEDNGLFVVEFDGTRAARLSGHVRDAGTGAPIENAMISVFADIAKAMTDSNGNYRLGLAGSSPYLVTASSFYHNSAEIQLDVAEGGRLNQDWSLTRKPLTNLTISVRDTEGVQIPGAQVIWEGAPYGDPVADATGHISIPSTPIGTYDLVFTKWGYKTKIESIEVAAGISTEAEVVMQRGVSDDFEYDLGWQIDIVGETFLASWERTLRGDIIISPPYVPAASDEFPSTSYLYYARVYNGEAYLISPSFRIESSSSLAVQYNYFWRPQGGNNDSLLVEISLDGGQRWLQINAYGDNGLTESWSLGVSALPVLNAGTEVMLRFVVREKGMQTAYALIDNLELINSISDVDTPSPQVFHLLQNYPNPFNHSTSIRFNTTAAAEVRLEIFNVRGERLRVLRNGFFAPGPHIAIWDGTDENGRVVGSGLYMYKLVSGTQSQTRMMILLK